MEESELNGYKEGLFFKRSIEAFSPCKERLSLWFNGSGITQAFEHEHGNGDTDD